MIAEHGRAFVLKILERSHQRGIVVAVVHIVVHGTSNCDAISDIQAVYTRHDNECVEFR